MLRLMRWIRKKFSEQIQVRLTCYFLLILLPLVFISLYTNSGSKQILVQQVNERVSNAMFGAMDNIDLSISNIEELSMMVSTDYNINTRLNRLDGLTYSDSVLEFQRVIQGISNINTINPLLSQITIFHASSGLMLSTRFGGKSATEFASTPAYMQALQHGTGLWIAKDHDYTKYSQQLTPIFNAQNVNIVRQMDMYNPGKENVLIITIGQNKLVQILSNLTSSPHEYAYLLDRDDRVMATTSATETEFLRLNLDHAETETNSPYFTERVQNHIDDKITMKIKSKTTGWTLVLVLAEKELYKQSDALKQFTYLIIIVTVVLAFVISWVVYRGIASPLSNIAQGIRQVRLGNLNTQIEMDRPDEFGYLTLSFNEMVREQRDLIKNNYEQQLLMSEMELRFLQSQINPHFLYNTLDSIYWKAMNYDADEISDMVLNLSKFFRLSLSKGKDVFSIRETMDHLQYYLKVQQIRYGNHFSVEVDVDKECEQVPLLKLLLQPLIENAILHGLEKAEHGGVLNIRCDLVQIKEISYIELEVTDNGKGMSDEKLNYVLTELAQLDQDVSSSYLTLHHEELFGLWNVKSRLKMYYGKEAEMHVRSKLEVGTTILIRIPLARCQEVANGESAKERDIDELDDCGG